VAREIPYGSIPRNEILTIEKQILRDLAHELELNVLVIQNQPITQHLIPLKVSVENIKKIVKTLEKLAE